MDPTTATKFRSDLVRATARSPVPVVVSGLAWVHKPAVPRSALAVLRDTLTLQPKAYRDDPVPPVQLYDEPPDGDWIGIPREYFLGWRRAHHQVRYELVTNREALADLPVMQFEGTLREDQVHGLNDVLHAFGLTATQGSYDTAQGPIAIRPAEDIPTARLGGMFKAATGWGKTVCAAALIAALGVPTLITINRKRLLQQWKDELARFIPGVRCLILGGKTRGDWRSHHIVLATLQKLSRKDLPRDFYEWPGLIITDEAHHIASRTWSEVMPLFKARWRFGLSATPRRKDGMDAVFDWHLGPRLHEGNVIQLQPRIKRMQTRFACPARIACVDTLLYRAMAGNRARNERIAQICVEAYRAGRVLFIVSKLLDHLLTLEVAFKDAFYVQAWRDDPNKDTNLTSSAEALVALRATARQRAKARDLLQAKYPAPETVQCVGKSTDAQMRQVRESARVIFATTQFVAEAFNVPRLDTLVLTLPLSDVEQVVGRILRPAPGKKDPIVVDIRDPGVSLADDLAKRRDSFYEELRSKYTQVGASTKSDTQEARGE